MAKHHRMLIGGAGVGGFKRWGVGRDGGEFGMLACTEMRSIVWPG